MPAPEPVNGLTIEKVEGKKALDQFIRLPWFVFKDDPNGVPPLIIERRGHLNRKQNPYFEHAEVALWIAKRKGRAVGRISAQIDENYLAHHQDESGQFGFLDAVNDPLVFDTLMKTAEDWLHKRGIKRAVGPFSLSINDESGLLVDGFDTPPFVMMGHARPYYQAHVERQGYQKAMDLFAYGYDPFKSLEPKVEKMLARIRRNPDVHVRILDKARYENDIRVVLDIFNDAWSDNWGFVPFTERELSHIAKELKPLIRPEMVIIAEVKGVPSAMAVAFPNLNEAIADLNGALLPFGWLKLLWRLKVSRIKSGRLALMGVKKQFRNSLLGSGLGLTVIDQIRLNSQSIGITKGELGWVLEDNPQMWRMIEAVGGTRDKVYRVYQKDLV